MPRYPADHVPAYRLHKRSGQAVVTLSGRDHSLGPFGSHPSKVRYHELIARWLASGRKPLDMAPPAPHPMFAAPAKITVAQLIDAHDRHSHTYYVDERGDPTTEIRNFAAATAPLRELFGETPADELSPTKLKAVRSRMIAKGWARTLINKHVNRLRSIWRWATEEELISPLSYQALRAVKALARGRSGAKESEPVTPVPLTYVAAVKPFVASQIWALIELQRLTGARGGELFKLRAIDLDTSGNVWTHTPRRHKTSHFGHKRIIYFGPQAQQVLRPFLAGRPVDAYLFSPLEAMRERQQLRATKGRPRRANQKPNDRKTKRRIRETYDRESYRKAIARACKLAEVPSWHPHQLRHAAATTWRSKYGPDVALTMLGDKTTRMVDVYAERDHATAMRIAGEIG